MKIFDNLPVEIDSEELILILGGDLNNAEKAREILKENPEIFEEGKKLASPRAMFDIFKVDHVDGNRVYLDSDEYFESELFSYFFKDLEYVVLGLATIGKELEDATDSYMQRYDYVKGMLLDGVGTIALGKTSLKAFGLIKEEAKKLNLKFSAPLSPGQIGWNVTDQRKIFNWLEADKMGMKLTDSSLMIPKKSVSILVGLGNDVVSEKDGCDFCSLRKTCPSRKVKDYRKGKI